MCYACGHRLEAEPVVEEASDSEVPCPSCGTMISGDAVMCYACGQRLTGDDGRGSKKELAPTVKKVLKKKII